MKTVTVHRTEIGSGLPKICAPIVGRTREEVLEQAAAIRALPVDLVEWRVDYFYDVASLSLLTVLTFLSEVRKALGDLPLLFTFRTVSEGGERDLSPQAYEELYKTVISSGLVDLIDVELSRGEAVVERLRDAARAKGVFLMLSVHDFEKTPPEDAMVALLQYMESLGADLAKLAVMPQTPEDTEALIAATKAFTAEASIPAVTMAMGELGLLSRICGEADGSAVTFGAVGKASAPGQLGVRELKAALEDFRATL